MPRFYFHVKDGVDLPDHDGTELPDVEAAKLAAITACGEAIRELGASFWDSDQWQMQVTDESGAEVASLWFSGRAKGPGM